MVAKRTLSREKLLANADRADVAFLSYKDQRDELARQRSEAISACRAAGITLPDIAAAMSSRGEKVTPERVRQMEKEGISARDKVSLASASD